MSRHVILDNLIVTGLLMIDVYLINMVGKR